MMQCFTHTEMLVFGLAFVAGVLVVLVARL